MAAGATLLHADSACLLAWAAAPQISIIDGRKYDAEGDGEDVLERCELLCNKQGQPLLAHGRSGRCA